MDFHHSLLSVRMLRKTSGRVSSLTVYCCTSVLILLSMTGSLVHRVNASPLLCLDLFSCQFGEEKRNVACSDPGIDNVPMCLNPSLMSLSLHNTGIQTIFVTSLRYYADLKYVNLSHNGIKEIEKKSFETLGNLEELHLADNMLSHLYSEIFLGLKTLSVLSLRDNLLEEIPDGAFQQLPQLKHLDLSHNRITTLGDNMLRGLPKLTVLLLSQNRLTAIPSTALNQVPHLAQFTIGGNTFDEIHKTDFESLRLLTYLDLSSTNFGTTGIALDAFTYVPGLRTLKLSDCQLETIPTEALVSLPELEELELSRNFFIEIPKGAFETNRRLSSLTITGNPHLERISAGALQDNLNLAHVDFSRNTHLTYLPPEDFRFLTRLSMLDLHGNNLQYIPHNAVSWGDVATWYLHDNPITCNCSSAWLRKMLLDGNRTSPPTILCAQPPDLSGVPLTATELGDLFCGLDSATQGAVIAFSVCGLVLIVACVAFFFLYRNRRPCVRQLLKGHKWGRNSRGSNHRSYESEYPCIKPVPVTEL